MFIDQEITIDISENQKMLINLKSDVTIKLFKIYLFDQKDKKIVNITFDKLHAQNKMHYITQFIQFNYFMFIVWKNTFQDRKNKAVIDIRDFNNIIEINNYSLSLQSNIITFMIRYLYIFTINIVDWFHQFNVRKTDRYKLTMISHRN